MKVNGVTTTDRVDATHAGPGHVALSHLGQARIEFRRIEIKELPPGAAPELVAKAPVVSGFLVELPPPAGRACLSADGLRLAYDHGPGAFAFREAPAFDVAKLATLKEVLTPLFPLASSPDGKRMAFTAGTKDGPKVALFHWDTNRFGTNISFTNLAISSAFSANGKYLATYLIQTPKGQPVEYWLHLHETDSGKSVKQWQLNSAPTFYGFTPDNRTLFFAAKGDDLARTWNIAEALPGTMAFPDVSKKHFFARDFSRFTYSPLPHELQVTFATSRRAIGKMDMYNPATQIAKSAFSPDNRFLLIGADDPDERPKGRAMLFEFATGREIATIQKLAGVPDRIEFAANGIALLQGQNLRPRLYRLPMVDALAKVAGPPNPGPAIPVAGVKPIELKLNKGTVSVSSFLVANDPPYKNKNISKPFLLPMEAGKTYQIDYRSTVFDCYLYLEDPDGRIVGEDDDGGGGLDSRIVHKATKSGKYRIIATSLEGTSTGKFSMNIVATGIAVAKAPPAEGFAPPKEKVVAMGPIGDYVALFNGKDLAGWSVQGKDGWKVTDGGEIVGQGPDTALVTTRKDFKNFNARIELSASADTEAFLAFRENPGPNAAVKLKGFTTRLIGDGESISAGNAGLNGTKFESGQKRVKVKAGEPITLEIQVRDDTIKIATNGNETASMPVPAGYLPGAIGLHVLKGMVRVKKFDVAEERVVAAKEGVPVEPAPVGKAEFVPLFNGKDLAGWQAHAKRPGNWRVDNGILIGSAPLGGSLYSARDDYQDFHLRVEARINDKGFGRLHVRAAYDPTKIPFKTIGYETLINRRPVGAKTGTLTATGVSGAATTPAKDAAAPLGEWFLLEIITKGDQVTVKVNGTTVAEYLDAQRKFAQKGHIVLQQDANAVIEFRKIEIMDPTAVKVIAPPPPNPPPASGEGSGGGPPAEKEGQRRLHGSSFSPGDAGIWRIDGKELVQGTPKASISIFFGNPKWTDYDFSVWAMRTEGNDHFGLWFRGADDKDMYIFILGGKKNTVHMTARIKDGSPLQSSMLDAKDSAIETDRWHHAKISVRGDLAQCYLDGVKIFEFTADKLRAGSMGLRTWHSAYRLKNIKVTAPDGKVLLEGLPDLPAGGIQP